MTSVAYLPIVADRYGPLVRHLYVAGLDLTGVTMRAQVRLTGDTPGQPLVDLLTVSNGNAQGLRLVEVTTDANGLPTSHVEIVINETTMEGLPYAGELGDAVQFAWDMQITLAGRKRRLAKGEFEITGDGVTGADAAPANRPIGYGRARQPVTSPWKAARLTFGEEQVTVQIVDADLVAPLVVQAKGFRDQAGDLVEQGEAAADLATTKSIEASNFSAAAAALANRFTSYALGNGATADGQDFTVVDPSGQWINVYRKGTSTGAGDPLIQLPGKAAYAAAAGAALVGTKRGNLQDVLDHQPMFARDYGVVGDGVTDDTVAAQAFIDACFAAGRRTANFGPICCKISGPLYARFVGVVFEPFGYGDAPDNSSGFYVVERPDGVPYTALTVTGFVSDMNVSVFGVGTIKGDEDHNVTADTRPRVNGVALGRPEGGTQLAASTIRGIRTYMLRGFGVKETNVFDTLIQNISVEYCGSADEYAYICQGDGQSLGTVNETVHLRVQVEFAIYRAIYISPFTLSTGFLNVHSERAVAHEDHQTWFFGGSIKLQNVRLDALNEAKASIKFLSNQMTVEMLRSDAVPNVVDPTGGVINFFNCAGTFMPSVGSNGRVNLVGLIGRVENIASGWVISGSAVSYLSVAGMADEQFAVVRDSDVMVIEGSTTSTQGNLRLHATNVASLKIEGLRNFQIFGGTRCTLKDGVQRFSYQKVTVGESSTIIGNVLLNFCGMRLNGTILGDMNYEASRQALIGDRAVITGGVANNGPPESGAYLDGLFDGMTTKNPKPVAGNPRGWMYAGGQWLSLGNL